MLPPLSPAENLCLRASNVVAGPTTQPQDTTFTYDRANRLHSTTQPFELSGSAPSITFD